MEPETKVLDTSQNTQPQSNVVEQKDASTAGSEDNPNQINWKRFREQREQERKEKEAADRRAAEKEKEATALKAAMEAILNKPQAQQNVESDQDLSEDDRIYKKVQDALARERQKDAEEQRRREQVEFPQKLVQAFPDFDNVCTTENLDYFEFHYPEAAAPFKDLPDSFDKWSKIYRAIKRFVPNPGSKKEQARAEKNFAKPQAMAAAGATSTGDSAPMQLTEKRREDNWARMQKVMKGIR